MVFKLGNLTVHFWGHALNVPCGRIIENVCGINIYEEIARALEITVGSDNLSALIFFHCTNYTYYSAGYAGSVTDEAVKHVCGKEITVYCVGSM